MILCWFIGMSDTFLPFTCRVLILNTFKVPQPHCMWNCLTAYIWTPLLMYEILCTWQRSIIIFVTRCDVHEPESHKETIHILWTNMSVRLSPSSLEEVNSYWPSMNNSPLRLSDQCVCVCTGDRLCVFESSSSWSRAAHLVRVLQLFFEDEGWEDSSIISPS